MMARAREDIGGKEAEKIFLLATNTNSGQKESAFCPDNGAVASCDNSPAYRDWNSNDITDNKMIWSDEQIVWYYRDPDAGCKWKYDCRSSLLYTWQKRIEEDIKRCLALSGRCSSPVAATAAPSPTAAPLAPNTPSRAPDSNAGMVVVGVFGALAASLVLSCVLVIF